MEDFLKHITHRELYSKAEADKDFMSFIRSKTCFKSSTDAIINAYNLINDGEQSYTRRLLAMHNAGYDVRGFSVSEITFCEAYLASIFSFELGKESIRDIVRVEERTPEGSVRDRNILSGVALSVYRETLKIFPAERKPLEKFVEDIIDRKRTVTMHDIILKQYSNCASLIESDMLVQKKANDFLNHCLNMVNARIEAARLERKPSLSQRERVARLYAIHRIFCAEKEDDEVERVTELANELKIGKVQLEGMLARRNLALGSSCVKTFGQEMGSRANLWILIKVKIDNFSEDAKRSLISQHEMIPIRFREMYASRPDLYYRRIPRGYRLERLENASFLLASAERYYSILLMSETIEEIFFEEIDPISYTFVRSLIIEKEGYPIFPTKHSLMDATHNHSAEFLAHLILSVPDIDFLRAWSAMVFQSPVNDEFIRHAEKIGQCLRILRGKGFKLPEARFSIYQLYWAGIDPEIDAYLGVAKMINDPSIPEKIIGSGCAKAELNLARKYVALKMEEFIRRLMMV